MASLTPVFDGQLTVLRVLYGAPAEMAKEGDTTVADCVGGIGGPTISGFSGGTTRPPRRTGTSWTKRGPRSLGSAGTVVPTASGEVADADRGDRTGDAVVPTTSGFRPWHQG